MNKKNKKHICCDGECNHDDCCGKIEENCPNYKSLEPKEELGEMLKGYGTEYDEISASPQILEEPCLCEENNGKKNPNYNFHSKNICKWEREEPMEWEEFDKICLELFENGENAKSTVGYIIFKEKKNKLNNFIQSSIDKAVANSKALQESNAGSDSFYRTIMDSIQWKEWVIEVRRRMDKHIENKSKRFTGCWDIDESMELGYISPAHFQDFLKFCSDKAVREERERAVKIVNEKVRWAKNVDTDEVYDAIRGDIINPNISSPSEEGN